MTWQVIGHVGDIGCHVMQMLLDALQLGAGAGWPPTRWRLELVGCPGWADRGWPAAAAVVESSHMGGAHMLPHHEKVQCLQWGYALASLGYTTWGGGLCSHVCALICISRLNSSDCNVVIVNVCYCYIAICMGLRWERMSLLSLQFFDTSPVHSLCQGHTTLLI